MLPGFAGRDHVASCNGTAPVEVSSGNRKIRRLSLRGNRRINHAIHMAAITQLRHKHSQGRAYYDRKRPREKPVRRRSGPSSARSATPSSPASRPTPARPQRPGPRAREGNQGTTLTPARPAHTPNASSSDQPLPDLTPPYGPAPRQARLHRRRRLRRKPAKPLDNNNNKEDSLCAPFTRRLPLLRRGRPRAPRRGCRSKRRGRGLRRCRNGRAARAPGRGRW
jgi:Transposase IS116/IS110/IS902 family